MKRIELDLICWGGLVPNRAMRMFGCTHEEAIQRTSPVHAVLVSRDPQEFVSFVVVAGSPDVPAIPSFCPLKKKEEPTPC